MAKKTISVLSVELLDDPRLGRSAPEFQITRSVSPCPAPAAKLRTRIPAWPIAINRSARARDE